MKKLKVLSVLAGIAMLASVFVGCSNGSGSEETSVTKEVTQEASEGMSQSSWAFVTYSLGEFAGKTVNLLR